MSDRSQQHQQSLDDLLAAFADQVQERDNLQAIPQSEDKELSPLQKTVVVLAQNTPESPGIASKERIKRRVSQAWQDQHQPRPTISDLFRQVLPLRRKPAYLPPSKRRQAAALRIAAAAALVIIAAFIILPTVGISGGSTRGTAVGELGPWALVGGVLLLGAAGLWLWWTSRRK